MNFKGVDNNELSSLPRGIFDNLTSLDIFVFPLFEFLSSTISP